MYEDARVSWKKVRLYLDFESRAKSAGVFAPDSVRSDALVAWAQHKKLSFSWFAFKLGRAARRLHNDSAAQITFSGDAAQGGLSKRLDGSSVYYQLWRQSVESEALRQHVSLPSWLQQSDEL